MSSDLIVKYKLWQKDVEECRDKCVSYSRQVADLTNTATEINDRVPLDDCSTEWYTFTDDELKEAYDNYTAQKKGYEQYYVDDNGDFDEDALKNSDDANTYYQIKDVILPTIKIEMDNRKIEQGEYPYDKDSIKKYIDTYQTNWKLYGLEELKRKIKSYQDKKKVCIDGGFNKPYTDDSGHSKDVHDEMYKKYVEAFNQLNPDYEGSCQQELNTRQSEYDDINNQIKEIEKKRRNETYNVYDKSTWKHDNISFTEKELVELSKLILESDYTNSNMFLSSTDDNVAMIDEQLRLLDAAKEELSTAAQPQFTYSTTLDNFLARIENKFYIDSLDVGDFIYLSIRDDYAVKLRVISMQYNPCAMNNDLSITFSNMISSKSKRDDFSYLLNSSSNHSKNSYNSSSSNNSTKNDGPQITTGLLTKLLNSGAFSNKVNQISNDNITQTVGGLLALKDLNSEMIKATDIEGKNGFFEYLQSKLISADKIVADSAELKKLSTFVANIDNLIAGKISADDLHAIHLTANNVVIDEAVISKLIAAKIQVGMLDAGTINTDKFTISSEDGGTTIKGNTMQFKDENGVVRIQIGKDENNKFTFCIFDESGKGVLIDSTGVKENAIANGLIKNDMVADGALSKDKLGFNIVEGDKNGNITAGKVLINGKGIDVEFSSIKNTITELDTKIDENAPVFVSVGNDSQNIPCDSSGKTLTAMIIHIPFKGYKGITECPCTATVMSTLPKDGMTSTIDTANSEVLLNITKGATLDGAFSGSVQIKFTVNGEKDLYKYFTWNKTTDGADGKDAVIYELIPSVTVIKKGEGNALSPASITFSAYKTIGNGTPTSYSGKFIIKEFIQGKGYSTVYTSSSSESITKEYTPTENAILIQCDLYVWDSTTILDSQTVTIITDMDSVKDTLTEVRQNYTNVSSKVDKNAATIADTITRLNTVEYTDEQGNTKKASFEEVFTKHEQTDDSIKATISSNKKEYADGLTAVDNKITEVTKDLSGFHTHVENTYITKKDGATKTDVTNLESSIDQTTKKIDFVVKGDDSSNMSITQKAITLISNNINITGTTKISSTGTDGKGTTTINELISKDGTLESSITENGKQINTLRQDADGLTGLFKRVGMGVGADNNYKQVESTTKVTVNGDGLVVTGNADSDDQINTTIMNGVYGTNKSGQDIFHLDQEGCHTGRVYMDRGYEVGMEKTNGDIAGMKMVPQLMMDNAGHQIACMCFVVPGGNS